MVQTQTHLHWFLCNTQIKYLSSMEPPKPVSKTMALPDNKTKVDLSFLTDKERATILKVIKADLELKKTTLGYVFFVNHTHIQRQSITKYWIKSLWLPMPHDMHDGVCNCSGHGSYA